ncbi:MAG: glycosyltransferase family 4 protein [candidate division Zixibacteria bacterium]|nr:glycosyltransferase family 4 protein [candidate division Zixibacteria bacterium]
MPRILTLGWSTSNHLRAWVKGLAQRGYEVTVVTYDGEPIDGIEVINLPKSPFGRLSYLRYLPRVRKLAREIKPDLIHAHFLTSYALWGASCARGGALGALPLSEANSRLIPLVLTAWGSDVTQSISSPIYRRLVRYNLGKASAVTAPSDYLKKCIGEISPVARSKTEVIPFGLDKERIANAKQNAKKDPSVVRILFFKHLLALYGPEALLRSFAQIANDFPTARLTLAGRGSLLGKLISLAIELGVEDKVDFPGYIDSADAYKFIAEHDIMVMPTRIPEGFGMAALEAQGLGLTVIASASGAVPEIVSHEKTGLLFEAKSQVALSSALKRLLSNKTEREKMGEAGAKSVNEKFNWERSLDQMDALYKRLL